MITLMDDDTFKQMMMLKGVLESSVAAQMVLSARLDALRSLVLDVFEDSGATPDFGLSLANRLRSVERERCNALLSGVADNDPNLASAMKREIDRMLG